MTDLMNQIQGWRTTDMHKTESIDVLTRELEDLNVCAPFFFVATLFICLSLLEILGWTGFDQLMVIAFAPCCKGGNMQRNCFE